MAKGKTLMKYDRPQKAMACPTGEEVRHRSNEVLTCATLFWKQWQRKKRYSEKHTMGG